MKEAPSRDYFQRLAKRLSLVIMFKATSLWVALLFLTLLFFDLSHALSQLKPHCIIPLNTLP